MTTIVVMAKECRPGEVKSRLTPPFSPAQAAQIAEASLRDTLDTLAHAPATRRVLCLEGTLDFDTAGWEIVPQGRGPLDERIADAIDGCLGPTIVVGMDTPQLRATHMRLPLDHWTSEVDAFFGPASDGGYWLLGLQHPKGDLVRGVPMSRPDTGAHQRHRLTAAGLSVRDLTTLTDIDTAESLREVRPHLPEGRLSRLLDDQKDGIHVYL